MGSLKVAAEEARRSEARIHRGVDDEIRPGQSCHSQGLLVDGVSFEYQVAGPGVRHEGRAVEDKGAGLAEEARADGFASP